VSFLKWFKDAFRAIRIFPNLVLRLDAQLRRLEPQKDDPRYSPSSLYRERKP
jgi:hypothetical protein